MNRKIMLIGFHNQKALGVRYLEKALEKQGYKVTIVFFKGFNSMNPTPGSQKELNLLKELINNINPHIIGLSIMSSLYLETVYSVIAMIKQNFNKTLIAGGVYASLFPEKCLDFCDYAIRGEGEYALVELCDSIFDGKPIDNMPNICFKKDGKKIINSVRPLCEDLDSLGYPSIGGENKYLIHNDNIIKTDPLQSSISFELSASRGCPFMCSYCSSINLRRIYNGKNMGKYVRFRSVDSVLEELNYAKNNMKNLKLIHFWDEIFSNEDGWVENFTKRYKEEINLPFEIWAHPLMVNEKVIRKLVDAGLYKVVMGIQSGSVRVRKDIFHRNERQEDILKASEIFKKCRVPYVIYDFIIQHPFENEEDLEETYKLCIKLDLPFMLQLHNLSFFPGTDIVNTAIDMKLYTEEEMEKLLYGTISEKFGSYWGGKSKEKRRIWTYLIYMTQFKVTRYFSKIIYRSQKKDGMILFICSLFYNIAKVFNFFRSYYKKGIIILKSYLKNRKLK